MQELKICKKCGAPMDKSANACPRCGAPAKSKTGWIIGGIIAAIIILPAFGGNNNSSNSQISNSNYIDSESYSFSTSSVIREHSVSEKTDNNPNDSMEEKTEAVSSETKSKVEKNQEETKKAESSKPESQAPESKKEVESKEEKPKEVESKNEEVSSAEEVTNNRFYVGETLKTNKVNVTMQSYGDYNSDSLFFSPSEGNTYIRAYFVVENTGKYDTHVSSADFDCYVDDKVVDSRNLFEDVITGDSFSPGRKNEGYVYFEVPINCKKIEIEYETSWWTQEKAIFVVKE